MLERYNIHLCHSITVNRHHQINHQMLKGMNIGRFILILLINIIKISRVQILKVCKNLHYLFKKLHCSRRINEKYRAYKNAKNNHKDAQAAMHTGTVECN